ncbi:MAG: AtpZ/AtpI family protein [Candidatus Sericytochromatia bacterium]|nr:AtpZ/AtpI family protein [Candidatus Sericytochromatia bacterium]
MSQPPALDSVYKMAGPVVMGVFLGYYLDQLLSSQPWGMLGMTFWGIATGFWSVLRPLYFPEKTVKNPPKSPNQTPQSKADDKIPD